VKLFVKSLPSLCSGTMLIGSATLLFSPQGGAAREAGLQGHPIFLAWVPYVLVGALTVIVGFLVYRIGTLLSRLEQEVAERTSELHEANEELARATRIDPLTGILNRRGLESEADSEVRRSRRNSRPFAVVLAGIDTFQEAMPGLGRTVSDRVVGRVADVLARPLREVDRLARWGGEEFVLLLPETDLEGAAVLAEKLRERVVDERIVVEGSRVPVTMTFGIAVHRRGEAFETTLARADTALHRGRQRGPNRVMIGNYKGLTLVR
jgi:diguanylate cyclase (GGDEF)-like protein